MNWLTKLQSTTYAAECVEERKETSCFGIQQHHTEAYGSLFAHVCCPKIKIKIAKTQENTTDNQENVSDNQ